MTSNKLKLAIISDLHFSRRNDNLRTEYADLADHFLLRAVNRINQWIKPDATLLLGDLLQAPEQEEDAFSTMRELKKAIDKLTMPVLVLPGNHDLPPNQFAEVFGPPPDWLDLRGIRLVPFNDEEQPEFNAYRPESELERMRQAGQGWGGATDHPAARTVVYTGSA